MDARMKAVLSSCILRCLLGRRSTRPKRNDIKEQQRLPKPAPMTERRRRGTSVFDFYNISYNAGYTKYRGAKKPSFSGFGPFRRLLSLLGWLSRFFGFCTVVLFECIALYVWSAFCFTIVRLLVKLFLTLMSSSLPLDSGAAYLQQAFLYLCRPNCFCNTTMQSLHGV